MILIGKSKIDMSELWSAYAFKNVGDWRIHNPETVPHSGSSFKHSVENERWADDYIAVQERGLAAVFGTPAMDEQTFLRRTRKYLMPEFVDGKIVPKEMTAQTYPTLIWPSKSPYDATGKSMYVFSLAPGTKNQYTVNARMQTIEIDINSYQTSNLYKVQYSWECDNDFGAVIYYGSEIWPDGYINVVTGTDEARTMQPDVDNQTPQNENYGWITSNCTPRGVLYWLCERMNPGTDMTNYDETYKNYHNAKLHQNGAPDSKIVLLIYPNLTDSDRTITYTLHSQWDQFRAINTEAAPLTITIKQTANTISFDNAIIQYYTANTVNAGITANYGPMTGDGGSAWVYFKIIGSDMLGNNVYYGDKPTQTASGINYEVTLDGNKLIVNTIKYDSVTHIWSMRFMYPENNPGSMKVVGNLKASCDAVAVCTEGAESVISLDEKPTTVPVPTNMRNATIKVSLKETPTNYYTANYSQYGKDGEVTPLTYGYKIIHGSEYATVSDSGKIKWNANNGEERKVVVTVYCVQDPSITTSVECKQASGLEVSYSPNDKEATGGKTPKIEFFKEEAAITEAITYNLNDYVPERLGYLGGDGDIFFRITGYNRNGVESFYGDHANEDGSAIKLTFTAAIGKYIAYLVSNSLEYNVNFHTWKGKVHWEPNIKFSQYIKGKPTLSYKTVDATDTRGILPSINDAEIAYTSADNLQNNITCELSGWGLKKTGISYIQETNADKNAKGVVTLTHKKDVFFLADTEIPVTLKDDGVLYWPANESTDERSVIVSMNCVYTASDGTEPQSAGVSARAVQRGKGTETYQITFDSGEGGKLTDVYSTFSEQYPIVSHPESSSHYTGAQTFSSEYFKRIAHDADSIHIRGLVNNESGYYEYASYTITVKWYNKTEGESKEYTFTGEAGDRGYGLDLHDLSGPITIEYDITTTNIPSYDSGPIYIGFFLYNIYCGKALTHMSQTIDVPSGETPRPPFYPVNIDGLQNTGWEPSPIVPATGPAKYTAVWKQPEPEPIYTDEIYVIVNVIDGEGSGEASIPSGRYIKSADIDSSIIIEDNGLSERLGSSSNLTKDAHKIYINTSSGRADGSQNGLNGVEKFTVSYSYEL